MKQWRITEPSRTFGLDDVGNVVKLIQDFNLKVNMVVFFVIFL